MGEETDWNPYSIDNNEEYCISYNVTSCWLYLKEYINDTRSHERQIMYVCIHVEQKPVKLTNNIKRYIKCYKLKSSSRSDINPTTATSSEQ